MMWYYAVDGKQAGPVSEQDLASMLQAGQITANDLVWREGMPNWQPLREVQATIPALAGLSLVSAGAAGGPVIEGDQVVCAECHQVVPKTEAIQYGGNYICATCKPAFFQKVREGVAPEGPGGFRYAGFWVRFCAKFIDNLVVVGASMLIGLVFGLSFRPTSIGGMAAQQSFSSGIGLIIGLAYTVFFLGRYGATPGKMALKLEVIRADGTRLNYGQATGRYFGEMLSGCPTLLIGYIIAAFDGEKRALHDRICGTRVIHK